jgi:hypothetical protein
MPERTTWEAGSPPHDRTTGQARSYGKPLPLTILAFWLVAQVTRCQEARTAQLAARRDQ